jgi:hypothetical protein
MKVFAEFARQSGLRISPESIEKRPRGEPDIRCTVQGEGSVAFELAELCAGDIAARIARLPADGDSFLWTSDPSASILRKKLKAQYDTPCPIELLLYTSGRVVTFDDVILDTLRPILECRNGPFRRVWLLGEKAYEVWPCSPLATTK